MTADEVEAHEQVRSQLAGLHSEIAALAKTKPDNPMNKFKVQLVNARLAQANSLLTGKFKPFSDFDLFDEDSLPSNSDVVLVLSQYLDALESWRSAHVNQVGGEFFTKWYWDVEGKETIETRAPTRFATKE